MIYENISAQNRTRLVENIARFQDDFHNALILAKRPSIEVTPIIVTKYQPLGVFPVLWQAGFTHVAENRVVQGSVRKEEIEKNLTPPAPFTWHLIGSLQKNKVKKALSSFQYVHAIDSLELAREISKICHSTECSYDILGCRFFIQVNPLKESTKHGFTIDDLHNEDVLTELEALLGKHVIGLMAMAPQKDLHGEGQVKKAFSSVQDLYHSIREKKVFDSDLFQSLSMGMSQDFEIALHYGATHIRIGSRIFEGIENEQVGNI